MNIIKIAPTKLRTNPANLKLLVVFPIKCLSSFLFFYFNIKVFLRKQREIHNFNYIEHLDLVKISYPNSITADPALAIYDFKVKQIY